MNWRIGWWSGSTGRGRSRSTRSSRQRSTARGASSLGARCRSRGARLRHQPRGRAAVRCAREHGHRRMVARARPARPVPGGRRRRRTGPLGGRRAGGNTRLRSCAPLRAGRTLCRAARGARRTARARTVRRCVGSRWSVPMPTPRYRSPAWARSSPTLSDFPAVRSPGVIVANELLDNLPFRSRRARQERGGWRSAWGTSADGFVEVMVPAEPELAAEAELVAAGAVPDGGRLPVPTGLPQWLRHGAALLSHGVLVVIDYIATSAELVARRAGRLVADVPRTRAGRPRARFAGRTGRHDRRAA